MAQCPCGSGSEFDDCCGPYLGGGAAPTPEALMRSRFTAFVRGDLDYIENTHAQEAQGDFDRSLAESRNSTVQWVGLEILETAGGGPGDDTGTVEFAARYKSDGGTGVHHDWCSFSRNGLVLCALATRAVATGQQQRAPDDALPPRVRLGTIA
jgi:SEC-C motif-containing protein